MKKMMMNLLEIIVLILKRFNYNYFDFNLDIEKSILRICKYDYPSLFKVILKQKKIDVNEKIKSIHKKAKLFDQKENNFTDTSFYRYYYYEDEKTLLTIQEIDVNSKSTSKMLMYADFEDGKEYKNPSGK